ncbi:MAG: hypothetical protein CMK07_09745 [Ponticaulis sp.]|nr:hypothetical protein [Ponticaulis sp.]
MVWDLKHLMTHYFYEARLSNDPELLLELFHPHAEIRLPGLLEPGEYMSAEDMTRTIIKLWRWQKQDIQKIVVNGDQIAVYYELTVVYAPIEEEVTTELCDIVTFKNGKIVSFIEFADTNLAKRLEAKHGAKANR